MAKIAVRQPPGYDATGAALVPKSLYDANSILYATTDDTPVALSVGASTVVGRKASGDIVAMTMTELKALVGWRTYGLPTGAKAQTVPRLGGTFASASATPSGRLDLTAIELTAGDSLSSITFFSGSTPGSSMTHQWFSLYDANRGLLRVTNDDTSTAWAANTAKTLNLASSYLVPTSGLYYVGFVVVHSAGAVPTLLSASIGHANLAQIDPPIAGWSSSSLTDPASAPGTAGSIAAAGNSAHYAYVS